MTRWERLELYLFDHDKQGTDFTANEYAKDTALGEVSEASLDIQDYLRAQRSVKSRTLYILHRKADTRTSNSRWQVGVKTKDARLIGKALASDTKRRVMRAFMPDLVALRAKNPHAGRLVETQITAVIDGAMKILAAAAEGMAPDEDES